MSEVEELIFPDLEYFEDYNGNFQNYFQAVYKIFESDFIKNSDWILSMQNKPNDFFVLFKK